MKSDWIILKENDGGLAVVDTANDTLLGWVVYAGRLMGWRLISVSVSWIFPHESSMKLAAKKLTEVHGYVE